MAGVVDWVKENSMAIIIVLVIILIAYIIISFMGYGLAAKSASSESLLPWKNRSEHLFSGDLSPQEMTLVRNAMAADPMNSANIKRRAASDYFSNKSETPALLAKLYM